MPSKRPTDPESAPADAAAAPAVPTVRRISNPRPKKAQPKPVDESAPDEPKAPEAPAAPSRSSSIKSPASAPPATEPDDDSPSFDGDWPAPETAGASSQEGGKRKRRRRKGKGGQGQSNQPGQPAPAGGADSQTSTEPGDVPLQPEGGTQPQRPQHQPRPPQPPQPPRAKIDPALLARRAWRIYLSEVSEEGIALINDHDARELTRRCFRLAEIFLEEQARRS